MSNQLSGTMKITTTWGGNGHDEALKVYTDSLDNIYVVGATDSWGSGGLDMCLIKFNSTGTMIWNRTWGGSKDDIGSGIVMDSSGNIYISGTSESFTEDTCVYLIKYSPSGNFLWNVSYDINGTQEACGLAIDKNNNIYLTGYYTNLITFEDLILLKFNSDGILQWNSTWGGIGPDIGRDLVIDNSSNIYITGVTWGNGINPNICLIKFNSSGTILWNETWGGNSPDEGLGIDLDTSGSIYVSGYTKSYCEGSSDMCLIKFSSNGSIEWNSTSLLVDSDFGKGIFVDNIGNSYIVGFLEFYEPVHSFNLYMSAFDSNGALFLNIFWDNGATERGVDITFNTDGNPIIIGISNNSGSCDIVILSFNTQLLCPLTPPEIILTAIILGISGMFAFPLILIIYLIKRKKNFKQ
ncbi:MAG: SBBP repeat-containing protein [Candidatus Lokiarchaeota archaeon]|nr:SBBP repeat-containing protein [Candidatus Lokiarchaeota archaeon]